MFSRNYFLVAVFLGILIALTPLALADDDSHGGEKSNLLTILEFVNLFLLLATIGLIVWQTSRYTQGSVSIIWGYFLMGTLLLAAIQLFIVFNDVGVIAVHDSTFHISWHLMFYLSMLLFFMGGRGLVNLASNKPPEAAKLKHWAIGSFVFVLIIFLGAEPVNQFVIDYFQGTILDTFGTHHFGAFLAALLAAFYMLKVRNRYKDIIGIIATPLLIFLALFGVFHLWELLTESWKLIIVEGSVIETVEQIIAIPALSVLLYGFYKSKQMMGKFTNTGSKVANKN